MGNYSNQLGLIHFTLHTKYDGDIKDVPGTVETVAEDALEGK